MRNESIYPRTDINVAFRAAFEDLPGSPQVLKKIVPASFPGVCVEILERRIDIRCVQWERAARGGCAILCQRPHEVRKVAHALETGPGIGAKEAANKRVGATNVSLHCGERSTGSKDGHRLHAKWSIVGLLLWARYGLANGRPFVSLREIYAQHLESPGTKGYTVREAGQPFRRFTNVRIRSQLSFGDLLEGKVGQRHQGLALSMAKALWPRSFIRRALPRLGLYLLIDARRA